MAAKCFTVSYSYTGFGHWALPAQPHTLVDGRRVFRAGGGIFKNDSNLKNDSVAFRAQALSLSLSLSLSVSLKRKRRALVVYKVRAF